MKKLFLSIILIASASGACNAQIRYGSELGGNMSNQIFTYNNGTAGINSTDLVFGARAGELLDCAIDEHWAIQPGLYYSMMGYGYHSTVNDSSFGNKTTGSTKLTTTLYYFQLPVHFLYRREKGPGELFISAGPYVGYAYKGKQKITGSSTANGVTTKIDSTIGLTFGADSNANMKGLDFGFGADIGYELPSGFFIRAGYDFGLANLAPINGIGTVRNSCFHITVGYLYGVFHKRKSNFTSNRHIKFRPPHNILAYP